MEKVTIFSDPQVIDGIIKNRINSFSARGAKNNRTSWTEDEIELRNAVVLDYIGKQGMSREETARQLSNRWSISMPTARNYVRDAIKDFVAIYKDKDKQEIFETYTNRLEGILQNALDNNQKDIALKTLDILNKMNGFYSDKTKIEVEGNIPISFDFS